MKISKKITFTSKTIISAVFLALLLMFIKYLETLYINKLIYINSQFDLEIANKISPFLGILLSSLFSIVTSFFLYINYIELVKTNSLNKEKQEKELSSNLAKMFFWEIQTSYIKLVEFGIFKGSENTFNYLNEPFVVTLETKEMVYNSAKSTFTHNGNRLKITEHLDKLEFLALSILNDNIDLNLIEKFLKTKFLGQVKTLLIFLAFCRSGNENYGESIIELYKKWGGEYGHILDRIEK